MLAAVYLQNRILIKSKGWKTPYELAFGKPPNINYLKVYGYKVYALHYKIFKINKLKFRVKFGYLIDYESTNIYKIWIPATNKIIRIKNVTFDKSKLFFSKKKLIFKVCKAGKGII